MTMAWPATKAPASEHSQATALAISSGPRVSSLLQVVTEEGRDLVEGDQVHPVVEIDMARTRNQQQFLGLGGTLVRVLAELPGMRLVARDEQHRARGDRLNVIERVEVHELHVAREGRVR